MNRLPLAIACALPLSLLAAAEPLVLALGWAAAFGMLLMARLPIVLCLAFVLFSTFRLHELDPRLLSLRLPQLLAMASLAVLLWQLVVVKSARTTLYREGWLLLGLFGVTTVGMVLATNSGLAFGYWSGNWIKVVIMCLAISWLLKDRSQMALAGWLIILSGALVAAVALYNSANGLQVVEGTRVTIGRSWGSMLGDPNDLALVLLLPVSFALNRALTPLPGRAVAMVVLVALILALLATQSRGGLLGLCAISGCSVLLRYRLPKWVWLLAPVALLLLMSLAGINERQSGGAAESGIDESAMGRLYAWQAAISMGLSHPLFGVGLDNFYSNYFFHSPHWDGRNHAVHSSWFQVLAEAGVLGLLLFVGFVAGLIQRARRLRRLLAEGGDADALSWASALYSGLIGFAVSATFLTQAFTWPLYVMASLVWAGWRIYLSVPELSKGENHVSYSCA
ncbi:O-antigen ligase family protein [Ferrimonas sp. YFM]|uniref:O-antigen ligase family protein n=1 Tax=Ferrimonas sp. YFM TaxID=3028878 RepID=UPI0025732FB1|nr:O-antigen ligase family protein [Ferrimonas sp. YFM]BDY04922.1 membrane protein [Ferrimonas sp. YFM]